jgi:hypothetical protein
VVATSRAGITEQEWDTNLGTNWSGQISCVREDKGEPHSDEQVSGAGYEVTRIEIEVNDGVVFATGYAREKLLRCDAAAGRAAGRYRGLIQP